MKIESIWMPCARISKSSVMDDHDRFHASNFASRPSLAASFESADDRIAIREALK